MSGQSTRHPEAEAEGSFEILRCAQNDETKYMDDSPIKLGWTGGEGTSPPKKNATKSQHQRAIFKTSELDLGSKSRQSVAPLR